MTGRLLTNQRDALRRYVDDGRIGIDNNAAERLLRGVALGRKNWMFAGSLRGARAAAVLFSLIAGCGLVGVDPQTYLADILARLRTWPSRFVLLDSEKCVNLDFRRRGRGPVRDARTRYRRDLAEKA